MKVFFFSLSLSLSSDLLHFSDLKNMISTHEKDLCEKNGPDFLDYWLKKLKMANFLQWAAAGSENIKWFD